MRIYHNQPVPSAAGAGTALCYARKPACPRNVRHGRCAGWAARRRRGSAVVEFAVVAPVFFLFIFGMIEYGRMVMVQQILTNAAREGARVGILDNSTQGDVTTAVDRYLTAANINGSTTTIAPNPPSSATAGNPVSVTVSVGFNQVSWLPSPFFLGGTTLSYTATMRRETNP
jgi:Flp pilus assembly protein TadG